MYKGKFKNKVMKKTKFFLIASLLLINISFVCAEGDMTSESQIDTTSIFEMPLFESDSKIELYRPVQIPEEADSVSRPLEITNYSTKASVSIEKGTVITDKSGNILHPLLKPTRKTLFNVADVPYPDATVIYQFLFTFGNSCTAQEEEENTCTTPPEHFSPTLEMVIPLPENVEEGSFDLMIFNPDNKKWYEQDFEYDDIAKLITLDYPQKGFIAFVEKGSIESAIKVDIGDTVVNQNDPEDDEAETNNNEEEEGGDSDGDSEITDQNTQESDDSQPDDTDTTSVTETKPKVDIDELLSRLYFDIPDEHWLHDDLEYMVDKGIFEAGARKQFKPNEFINRAEAAKILTKTFNLPLSEEVDLLDFSRASWFTEYAQTMIDLGIMSPYEGKAFLPNKKISRAEALTIIIRSARIELDREYAFNSFSDVSKEDWFAPEVAFAVDNEIIGGVGDEFVPSRNVTRAEFVKMTKRVLVYQQSLNQDDLVEDFPGRQEEKVCTFFTEDDLQYFEKILEKGDIDLDIKRAKKILKYYGYYNGELTEDFDDQFSGALLSFQLGEGIIDSANTIGAGGFGPSTRAKLNLLVDTLRAEWL